MAGTDMNSSPSPTRLTTPAQFQQLLRDFDVFLFDCDGVLWTGDHLLPKVKETILYLRAQGKRLVFVSNNSGKSRRSYKAKLESMGIPTELEEIFPSSYSSAVYLSRVIKLQSGQRVYVIGGSGVMEELANENVPAFGGPDPEGFRRITEEDWKDLKPDASVGAVLCGIDTEISYLKLARAHAYLQNKDCHFLLTNQDSTYPTHGGKFPGAGSLSYPLIYSTKRTPKILGKPSPEMLDAIEARFQFDRQRACFVGDRLDTDIQFAINSHLGGSLMVLTGISTEDEILGPDAPIVPKYYCDYLGQLFENREQ